MEKEIIFLRPVFKETIWGGKRLGEFGYSLPGDHVGECWAISAHPRGDCVVSQGALSGARLSELWRDRRDLFGGAEGEKFPLLTKIIDAAQDLSIQAHPNDEYAREHENGAMGKTECWLVLDAKPGATIVIGHNAKNHDEVKSMIEGKRWREFIREIPVRKDDFFYIEPGTVHAIKGGTLILETQQSSDITYRVYDYDRLSDGKPRALHVRQSIDVITAPFVCKAPPKRPGKTRNKNLRELAGGKYFSVWDLRVDGSETVEQDQKFLLASVIEGAGAIDGRQISKGAHFILPSGYGRAEFSGNLRVIFSACA